MQQGHAALRRVAEIWDAFTDWFNRRSLSENAVLLTFAVITGVASALGVVAFYKSIDLAYRAFYEWPTAQFPRVALLTYRPVVTAAGFVLAWWVMRRPGRGHEGMNVPDVQLAVVRRGGDVAGRPALARTAASAITIGSGGSAGSEGPVVVLGAAIGSWLGRTFRFAPGRVIVLVGCATGAAISAAFNAPARGRVLRARGSRRDFLCGVVRADRGRERDGGGRLAIGVRQPSRIRDPARVRLRAPKRAGTAVSTSRSGHGDRRGAVRTHLLRRRGSRITIEEVERAGREVADTGGGRPHSRIARFLSGGVLVGYGHLAIHIDVFGRMAWYGLALLVLAKIVATSVTLNSGGSGGVFTPSLYIGAATGGAFAAAIGAAAPSLGLHPEAYALVGMGAMIAGATDAPITGILLVFEMTNDYAIVLPLMLTVVIAHAVARRLQHDSLYTGWLRRRGETIEHGADRDVLAGLHVFDAYDRSPQLIRESAPVSEIMSHLGTTDQTYFPVVDDHGGLVGIITTTELGALARDHGDLGGLVVAGDVARPSETVSPNDSLLEAIRRMGVRGAASLPVVDARSHRLIGLLSRAHLLALYERTVSAARAT